MNESHSKGPLQTMVINYEGKRPGKLTVYGKLCVDLLENITYYSLVQSGVYQHCMDVVMLYVRHRSVEYFSQQVM